VSEPWMNGKESVTFDRVSTPAQIRRVEALGHVIWHRHYTPLIGSAQVEYMLDRFQSSVAIEAQIQSGYEYDLIHANSEPVGYFAIELRKHSRNKVEGATEDGPHLFLSKIYLLENARGKGLGRRCFDFVQMRAMEGGVSEIRLTVNKENPSQNTYERWGMVRTGSLVTDIGNGFLMDDWEYRFSIEGR